jgi:hypothetical protein
MKTPFERSTAMQRWLEAVPAWLQLQRTRNQHLARPYDSVDEHR